MAFQVSDLTAGDRKIAMQAYNMVYKQGGPGLERNMLFCQAVGMKAQAVQDPSKIMAMREHAISQYEKAFDIIENHPELHDEIMRKLGMGDPLALT